MAFDLTRVLRSLLFASPGSISVKDIQAVFTRFHEEASQHAAELATDSPEVEKGNATPDGTDGTAVVDVRAQEGLQPTEVPSLVTATQIREAMEAIGAQWEATGEVYRLQETHQGWRLVTSADCAEWVRLFRNQPKPLKLSQSAMETLAIVAYRQPVVRSEIESIRGVSVDSAINRLLERELIRIVGRADLPGRPIQYGTTETFLEFVGIKSIDELPASDVLSSREIDAWLKRHEEQHPVADRDLGLDTESGDATADIELAARSTIPDTHTAEFDFGAAGATAETGPARDGTEADDDAGRDTSTGTQP
jgi:segregation and condensation protein B